MIANIWIKIEAKKQYRQWYQGRTSVFKKKPDTNKNEVAIALSIEIPDAFFETPQLKATISIPEDSVTPVHIDVDVTDNIANILSQQLGITVHVSSEDPDNIIIPAEDL